MILRWTEEACDDIAEIIDYLENKWSQKIAESFKSKLLTKLELLSSNPYLGKSSDRMNGIRKWIISKHTSRYYQINEDTIELLRFFASNRGNQPF